MAAIGAANAAGSAAAVGGAGPNGERGGAGESGAGLAAGDGVRCRSWTGTTSPSPPQADGQRRRWCMGKAARKQWRSICESWWRRATMTRTTLCAIPPSQKKRATPARSSVRNCQLCCDVDLGMPKMVLAQVPLTSYLKPVLLGRARRRGDRLQVGPFGEPVRRREPVDTGEADDGA